MGHGDVFFLGFNIRSLVFGWLRRWWVIDVSTSTINCGVTSQPGGASPTCVNLDERCDYYLYGRERTNK